VQKQLPEYLEKLQKESDVQILDERLKPEPVKLPTAEDAMPTPAPKLNVK
jgi:hypothetical protein